MWRRRVNQLLGCALPGTKAPPAGGVEHCLTLRVQAQTLQYRSALLSRALGIFAKGQKAGVDDVQPLRLGEALQHAFHTRTDDAQQVKVTVT